MRYMGEIKNRSLRLDEENYKWLAGLPGRSLNEAVERLRRANAEIQANTGAGLIAPALEEKAAAISEILELVRGLPDATDIEDVIRNVIQEAGGSGGAQRNVTQGAFDPATIPGVTRGPLPAVLVRVACEHCGEKFETDRPKIKRCSDCEQTGHAVSRYDCAECRLSG